MRIFTGFQKGVDLGGWFSQCDHSEERYDTFIMAIMMIPAQVSAVGFVQLMNKLHMTNNYIPLIVPSIAAPVVFFYMKQYMESVLPLEIVEAARCDGSGEFRTFNTIILPIMKPAIAVQAIFSFVSSWNNYFIPALLLDKAEMKTVPIMIAQLRSADYSKFDMGKVYMFILLAILPVMLVYIILSKSIIKGVTSGSVKGSSFFMSLLLCRLVPRGRAVFDNRKERKSYARFHRISEGRGPGGLVLPV